MLDTTKMKVEEIREVLVSEYGVSREEVESIKGKGDVVAKLREYESVNDVLENVELEETISVDTNQAMKDINWNDKNWTEYVISLMYPDELFEGHPKVDGLRRVADLLMGPIRLVRSEVVQTPDLNNNFHATVKVSVMTEEYEVDGSADAGPNNTQASYAKHPVAVAESRAEGRAYRKLLRLRNIISAEEAVSDEQIIDPYETINSTQIKMIDKICNMCNINVEKLLKTHDIEVADYMRTPKNKAGDICAQLNGFNASRVIPEELQGYDFNWR